MTMPAGKYFVGDLALVFDDREKWYEVCDFICDDDGDGEFVLDDGRRFASYSTFYGDGVYSDQFDNKYRVDSGIIGCIRMDDIPQVTEEQAKSFGAVIDFPEDFETYSYDGEIQIGHVVIPTKDWGEEEEYEFEYVGDCEE